MGVAEPDVAATSRRIPGEQPWTAGLTRSQPNDQWADGRRYLGIDVLSRSRLALITSTTNQNQEATTTIGAISA